MSNVVCFDLHLDAININLLLIQWLDHPDRMVQFGMSQTLGMSDRIALLSFINNELQEFMTETSAH
ncbi:hypothetical protein D3C79_1102910 [compost metagenome]